MNGIIIDVIAVLHTSFYFVPVCPQCVRMCVCVCMHVCHGWGNHSGKLGHCLTNILTLHTSVIGDFQYEHI